jgi:hypothetical protein
MRYGKRFAHRSLEVETLFLVTTIVFAVAAIGVLVGQLWIS